MLSLELFWKEGKGGQEGVRKGHRERVKEGGRDTEVKEEKEGGREGKKRKLGSRSCCSPLHRDALGWVFLLERTNLESQPSSHSLQEKG